MTTESNRERIHDELSVAISSEPWDTDNYAVDPNLSERVGGGVGAPAAPSPETPDNHEGNDGVDTNDDGGDAENDDITEIGIDGEDDDEGRYGGQFFGGGEPLATNRGGDGATPEENQTYNERRREALVLELQRAQKKNFIHFAVLFLVPTGMIILVVWGALSKAGVCDTTIPGIGCYRETRKFVHAFTSRCLCQAFVLDQDYEME